MTAGLASAKANAIIDSLLGTAYVQLHTGDPGAAGTSNPAAGSTDRVAIAHASASAGSASMTGTQPSWTNEGATETLTHISIWDAAEDGNLLGTAQLSASRAWVSGDTFTLTSNTWSITPVAS